MTLRVGAAWLPSALLLLQVLGSLSLSGPHTVTGTVGGSLSVQCRYEEEFTKHIKFWCKDSCSSLIPKNIVETTKSEREVKSGPVSIRDDPANLTFTVTLDNLTEEDGGTYMCGISIPWSKDPMFEVKVSVFPAPTETPSTKVFTSNLGPLSSLLATTWPNMTRQDTLDPSQHPRSLLSDVYFLLMVFLELPLLLSMLSAVLWVNRPQKSSGWRGNQADCENQ
ncbi:CMRF35-like molecule 6 isoform X1 [Rhinolophus sinicus]|uniref:CMRF35-like molecule 6 isoform X1 n=1 Tax=Rhinolophus sinicus TaxID=89399 RepID=UPI003D7A2406